MIVSRRPFQSLFIVIDTLQALKTEKNEILVTEQ